MPLEHFAGAMQAVGREVVLIKINAAVAVDLKIDKAVHAADSVLVRDGIDKRWVCGKIVKMSPREVAGRGFRQ